MSLHRCIYNCTKHQSEVPKRNKIELSSLTRTHRSNEKNKFQEIRQHSERLWSAALARWPRDRPARLTAAFAEPHRRLSTAFAEPHRRLSTAFAEKDRLSTAFAEKDRLSTAFAEKDRLRAAFFADYPHRTAFSVGVACAHEDTSSWSMYQSRKHSTWRNPFGTDAASQKHAHVRKSQSHSYEITHRRTHACTHIHIVFPKTHIHIVFPKTDIYTCSRRSLHPATRTRELLWHFRV